MSKEIKLWNRARSLGVKSSSRLWQVAMSSHDMFRGSEKQDSPVHQPWKCHFRQWGKHMEIYILLWLMQGQLLSWYELIGWWQNTQLRICPHSVFSASVNKNVNAPYAYVLCSSYKQQLITNIAYPKLSLVLLCHGCTPKCLPCWLSCRQCPELCSWGGLTSVPLNIEHS